MYQLTIYACIDSQNVQKIQSIVFCHKSNEINHLFGIKVSNINDKINYKGNINQYLEIMFNELSNEYTIEKNINCIILYKYNIHLYKDVVIITTESINE